LQKEHLSYNIIRIPKKDRSSFSTCSYSMKNMGGFKRNNYPLQMTAHVYV